MHLMVLESTSWQQRKHPSSWYVLQRAAQELQPCCGYQHCIPQDFKAKGLSNQASGASEGCPDPCRPDKEYRVFGLETDSRSRSAAVCREWYQILPGRWLSIDGEATERYFNDIPHSGRVPCVVDDSRDRRCRAEQPIGGKSVIRLGQEKEVQIVRFIMKTRYSIEETVE